MKRILSWTLALLCIFYLTGCGTAASEVVPIGGSENVSSSVPVSEPDVSIPNNSVEPDGAPVPEGVQLMPDAALAAQIIGSAGRSIIALSGIGRDPTVSVLDWDSFELLDSVRVEGDLVRYWVRNDMIYLLFSDRAVKMDENLVVQKEQPLPLPLLQAMEEYRGIEDPEAIAPWPDSPYFDGYDVSPDLDTFAYATLEGLFVYTDTHGLRKFLNGYGPYGDIEGEEEMAYRIHNVILSVDGARVYCETFSYRGPVCYDINTGEEVECMVDYDDSSSTITPEFSGSGDHWTQVEGSRFDPPRMGENHYISYYLENKKRGIQCGLIENPNNEEAKIAVEGLSVEIYGSYYLGPLLSDGRIIFSASDSNETYYYCTKPYDEL